MSKRRKPANGSKSEPVPVTPAPRHPQPAGKTVLEMILGEKRGRDETIAAIEGLARKIPCSPDIIEAIIYFDHEITPTMAQRLEKHLGLKAADWLELDMKYKAHLRWLDTEGESEAPPF